VYRFHRWRDAIQFATDRGAVLGIIKDYVRAIPPEVVAVLPADCQKVVMGHAPLDIQEVAVSALQAELAHQGSPEVREMIHEVAHTFAAASTRLVALHRNDF
jgi:hypothetical protein